LLPNKTLGSKSDNSVSGIKQSKERITIGVCSNANATDKRKLTVIHKFQRPRCFGKNFNPNVYCEYYYNKKAWMTQDIFTQVLKNFNDDIKRESDARVARGEKERKVLLLVDNAAGHGTSFDLSHVKVHFLPPNTTSWLQPMDAGIIRNFKAQYTKLVMNFIVDCLDKEKKLVLPDVKDAIKFANQAWNLVTKETIQNCFKHCDILKGEKNNVCFKSIEREISEKLLTYQVLIKTHSIKFAPEVSTEVMSVDELLKSDESENTTKMLTEQELDEKINEIIDISDPKIAIEIINNDDDMIEPVIPPNIDEAKSLMSKLELFFDNSEFSNELDIQSLNILKNKIDEIQYKSKKQSKITNFFTKDK